ARLCSGVEGAKRAKRAAHGARVGQRTERLPPISADVPGRPGPPLRSTRSFLLLVRPDAAWGTKLLLFGRLLPHGRLSPWPGLRSGGSVGADREGMPP